jgi:hypothetical protein
VIYAEILDEFDSGAIGQINVDKSQIRLSLSHGPSRLHRVPSLRADFQVWLLIE